MVSNERIKKYLDAGTVLGQVTRARAEEIVRELASAGDIPREQTQEWVDNLVERSRKTSEQILELIRHEVSAQLSKIDPSTLEKLADQVSDLLKRSAAAGRSATADAAAHATKGAQAARGAADKGAQAARARPTRVPGAGRGGQGHPARHGQERGEEGHPVRGQERGEEGHPVRGQEEGRHERPRGAGGGQESRGQDGGDQEGPRGQEGPGHEGRRRRPAPDPTPDTPGSSS